MVGDGPQVRARPVSPGGEPRLSNHTTLIAAKKTDTLLSAGLSYTVTVGGKGGVCPPPSLQGGTVTMMGNWYDYNSLYVDLHIREMRAAAQEARQLRQVRRARPLRRRVGRLLIRAGETLAR